MRKVVVGLLSAVLASGVGFSLPVAAVAAPPVVPPDAVPAARPRSRPVTRRPTLRGPASRAAAAGRGQCGQWPREGREARCQQRRQHGQGQRDRCGRYRRSRQGRGRQGPVRRAGPGEDRQDLRDPGRVRQRAAPGLPRLRHQPGHCRPDALRRSGAQQDPAARPDRRQHHGLAGQLLRRLLPEAVLRHRQERRVAEDLLRDPVLRALQRQRQGHRLGQGQVQRGAVRPLHDDPTTPTATTRRSATTTSAPTASSSSRTPRTSGSPSRRTPGVPTRRSPRT